MSAGSNYDGPRDQESGGERAADEPTTGPPAGAAPTPGPAPQPRPRPAETKTPAAPKNPAATTPAGATPAGTKAPDARRRKRRLIVAGISVAAALVVIAVCATGLLVVRAFFQDSADDTREVRRLQGDACLELEVRLNRLTPPGATTSPQSRAAAVRAENAATRIYLDRLADQRVSDSWRELLDARTTFAEALDTQAKSRTPAFYVAPAPRDGISPSDQLARWSPASCAGPVRRLAAPDL